MISHVCRFFRRSKRDQNSVDESSSWVSAVAKAPRTWWEKIHCGSRQWKLGWFSHRVTGGQAVEIDISDADLCFHSTLWNSLRKWEGPRNAIEGYQCYIFPPLISCRHVEICEATFNVFIYQCSLYLKDARRNLIAAFATALATWMGSKLRGQGRDKQRTSSGEAARVVSSYALQCFRTM